jgi:hypothetical protein
VKDEDFYREINLSPSQAWQAYQFEEYRYPEDMPPIAAYDIELNQLKRTHYGFKCSRFNKFMQKHQLKWSDLYRFNCCFKHTQGMHFLPCNTVAHKLTFTINVIGYINFNTIILSYLNQ